QAEGGIRDFHVTGVQTCALPILVGGKVRLVEVPGVQSQFTDRDYTIAAETALASAAVGALLAAHGVADPATVDCFAAGSAIAVADASRTMRVRCAERRGARSVAARVLAAIYVLGDVDAARVLHARDAGPSARTDAVADLDASAIGPDRVPLPQDKAPLPAVHGFTIDGGRVRWGEWRFHLRMDPRVGLVLSTVSIDDGARQRPLLYQAHLSEIFVPYMDPAPGWYDRAVLDVGEYAYDGLAESLAPGIDCPGDAAFIDGVVTDERGVSRPRPRLACLFERDTGLVA